MVGSRPRILVVDDERDIRDYLADLLRAENCEVVGAASGAIASRLLDSEKFQLVISDIVMSNGNGLELLAKIRALHPYAPPVILISGCSPISVAEAYALGATAFFPKPFKVDAFLKTVARALKLDSDRSEQRLPRVELDENVQLSLEIAMPNLPISSASASILDIGQGGMFFACDSSMPDLGSIIVFEISFLDSKRPKFQGRGIVRWIRPARDVESGSAGVGVEFLELTDKQISEVFEVLNYVQTRDFIPSS